MESLSHFTDGVQMAWDSTSIGWAQKCPRYYQYKMLGCWESKLTSVHLVFGGHYATALEHFHKHIAKGLDFETALEEVVQEILIATWEIDENGEGKPWNSMHAAKTRESLIRSIIWYIDNFKEDPTKTVILSNGAAAVEYSFSLSVDNGITICGHLDRVCEYSGDYYIMDQKTTGTTISPSFFEQFNPSTQMSLYTFAGKAIFDLPIKGVIIDGAQIAVGFTRFERGMTFRTDEQLDEWYDGTMQDITRIQDLTLELNGGIIKDMPMNPTACGNYGGCEFRGICSKSPQVRESFLAGAFNKRKVWNPLERR